MTTPDSAEAVNVRIAELCGMNFLRYRYWYNGHDNKKPWHAGFKTRDEAETRRARDIQWGCGEVESYMDHSRVPDYSGSLDAMHEAVASLSPTLQIAFASVLFDVCGSWAAAVNSTPTQRATAFLRVANH